MDGIYRHYEGTDAQCSGVQLEREITWANNIGTNGALRYLDCSGNHYYIYSDNRYFYPINGNYGSGVYYSGPSGIYDYIQFGDSTYIYSNISDIFNILNVSGDILFSGANQSNIYGVSGISLISSAGNVYVKASYSSKKVYMTGNSIRVSGYAGVNIDSDSGDIRLTCENTVGLSGTYINTFCNNLGQIHQHTTSMEDDATINIDDFLSTNGQHTGIIIVSWDSVSSSHHGTGMWAGGSSISTALVGGTSLNAATDSDGNFCVYGAGADIVLKNRIGYTVNVVITYIGMYGFSVS